MPVYTCEICGHVHDDLLLDIGYKRPGAYFKIPAEERQTRIQITVDWCSIDDTEFYIRGVLALPIQGSLEEFCWGVWAQIQKHDFYRYSELWDDEQAINEPPFMGVLSGEIGVYPASDGLPVRIQLQSEGQRPRFWVMDEQHPLAIDQQLGITHMSVQAMVASLLER